MMVQMAWKACVVADGGGASAPWLCRNCTGLVQKALHDGAVGGLERDTTNSGGASLRRLVRIM